MTEPPPPWARPDPAAAPPPRPAAPVRPESAPEPAPEPEPEWPPLFPDETPTGSPLLFPGGAPRRRTRPGGPGRPEAPRTVRRVRAEDLGPAGGSPSVAPGGPPPGPRPPASAGAPMSRRSPPRADAPARAAAPPRTAASPPTAAPPPEQRQTGSAGQDADPLVGVVAGPMTETRSRRSYPGPVVLTVAAILMTTTVLGRAIVGGVSVALVIVPVVLVTGVWLAQRLACGKAELSVPVRRFRLQPADGRTGYFVIEGELDPGALHSGDLVRVHGQGHRDGHTLARSVDILASLSGPVVREVAGRLPSPVLAARLLSGVSIGLAVLLVGLATWVIAR